MIGSKASGAVLLEKPYKGDVEPTQLIDSSRWKNHGTYTDITDVQLPSGQWVRSFNGSTSVIDCGADESLDITTDEMTIMAWVNSDGAVGADFPMIAGKRTGSSGYGIHLQGNLTPQFWVYDGGWNGSSTSNLTAGTWNFVVGVLSGGNVVVYVNCVAGPAVASGAPVSSGATTFKVGYEQAGREITGDIALVRVLRYSITIDTMRAVFTKQAPLFGLRA